MTTHTSFSIPLYDFCESDWDKRLSGADLHEFRELISRASYNEKYIIKSEEKDMLEKMKSIIAEQLSVEESEITEETSFKEDLGADSLDLFELIMALEEEYNTEIPSDDLQKLTTVGEVMEYLKQHGVEE